MIVAFSFITWRAFLDRSIQRPALDEVYRTLKVHHRIAQDQVSPKLVFHDAILLLGFVSLSFISITQLVD